MIGGVVDRNLGTYLLKHHNDALGLSTLQDEDVKLSRRLRTIQGRRIAIAKAEHWCPWTKSGRSIRESWQSGKMQGLGPSF